MSKNLKGIYCYIDKKDGVVVLTSVNRARVFSACFNLEYPIKKNL